MKQLMCKLEQFLQRLRWKVWFFENPETPTRKKETYGFKTYKTAPQSKSLTNFESDLADLLSSKIQFTNFRSPFQRKLQDIVSEIKTCENVLVNADKTSSIYAVSTEDYKKLLRNNITKDYKIAPSSLTEEINDEARNIACELELADRIEKYGDACAFVTIKDHKDNFENDPKCRLINPAKTNIGKISKQILQKINKEVRKKTELTQWQSTKEVLDWFSKIKDKGRKRFMQLDIVEFYPSITEELLSKALDFAELHTEISSEDRQIIMHSRQALLFTQDERGRKTAWTKKNSTFDVTMGAPDGAEVCELVGLFLLNEVKQNFPELNFGLYRDDGLAEHRRIGGRQMEAMRQRLQALFRQHGLRTTIDPPNKIVVNFLDVTLNLEKDNFCPYRKPNDEPLYVHSQSNHPPAC